MRRDGDRSLAFRVPFPPLCQGLGTGTATVAPERIHRSPSRRRTSASSGGSPQRLAPDGPKAYCRSP